MRWLWFVASLLCFAVVFKTPSMGLAVLCLLAALAFLLIGTVALVSSRIDSRSQDVSAMLGPDEIRRIREANAKRLGESNTGPSAGEMAVPAVMVGGVMAAHAVDTRGRDAHQHAPVGVDNQLASRDVYDSPSDTGGGYDAGSDGGGDGGGGGD